MKFYQNKEKFIEKELENLKKALEINLDTLPNEELPFMENHLRVLYFESYFLLAYKFYNASLVICGILLENLVKEKLGIPKIVWCKKGETSKNSKEQLIKNRIFTEKQFNQSNKDTIALIKTFKFSFLEMSLKNAKEIKNFEHFVIAVLNPPYND